MKRLHVFVEGRVQGVFFRESTRLKAVELGLRGWVRNLVDGRVEVLVEGGEQAVDEAVTFLRNGPPYARVDAIEAIEEPASGELDGFRIVR